MYIFAVVSGITFAVSILLFILLLSIRQTEKEEAEECKINEKHTSIIDNMPGEILEGRDR